VATHADVDHIQGLAKAKTILKAPVLAHPKAVASLESGDTIKTFAEIAAQNVHMPMPPVKIDREIANGDTIEADFGTCAPHWPLIDEWDRELAEGRFPNAKPQPAV
jgi:glyoxylase-like metal-dependent hydrolase (beta-lactamase superfamily II)